MQEILDYIDKFYEPDRKIWAHNWLKPAEPREDGKQSFAKMEHLIKRKFDGEGIGSSNETCDVLKSLGYDVNKFYLTLKQWRKLDAAR